MATVRGMKVAHRPPRDGGIGGNLENGARGPLHLHLGLSKRAASSSLSSPPASSNQEPVTSEGERGSNLATCGFWFDPPRNKPNPHRRHPETDREREREREINKTPRPRPASTIAVCPELADNATLTCPSCRLLESSTTTFLPATR